MRNALLVLAVLLVLPQTVLAQVNQPPVADAGPDVDLIIGENAVAQLQGSGTDPDGDPIVSFLWNIDSAPALSQATLSNPRVPNPLLVPDAVGDYVLSLVVSDGIDVSLPDTVTIRVAPNLPPTAVAVADVSSGTVPLTVNFDGSQSSDPEGRALSYSWVFGDLSTIRTEQSPTHVYRAPGTFLATLTVTDAFSQTAQDTVLITVLGLANIPPTATPTAVPDSGTAPLTVQFAANASDGNNDPLSYSWDFGDPGSASNTSTLADPGHLYTAAGSYTVSLTVDDGQDSFSTSLLITMEPRLDAVVFSPDIDNTSFGGTTVHAARVAVDSLDGTVVLWDIGDLDGNVTAVHALPDGALLLSFGGLAFLPGGVTAEPGDVVRFDGGDNWSLEFRPSVDPVQSDPITDALSGLINEDLLLSFDGTVILNLGGVTVEPEDLVLFNRTTSTLTLYFDGSEAGVPAGLNLDAAHFFVTDGHLALSFAGPGTMGSVSGLPVSFDDEDVLEFRFNRNTGTWELLGPIYDGSAQHAGWVNANLDALFGVRSLLDRDGDGISDSVDGRREGERFIDEGDDPENRTFTDEHLGGRSFGIVEPGGGLLTVEGVVNAALVPAGLLVTHRPLGNQSTPATVTACSPPVDVVFDPGEVGLIFCGSMTLQSLVGPIVISPADIILVTAPTGTMVTISEVADGQFKIENISPDGTPSIIVQIGEQVIEYAPGDSGIPFTNDIKPDSDRNSINTKSNGVVPVAILGSDNFDVSDVDGSTLAFGPAGADPVHDLTDPLTVADHLQDVNMDGFTDLVSHYRQKETGLALGDTEACLTGETFGGTPIHGCDAVETR